MKPFGFLVFIVIPFIATFWLIPHVPGAFYDHWGTDAAVWFVGISFYRHSII